MRILKIALVVSGIIGIVAHLVVTQLVVSRVQRILAEDVAFTDALTELYKKHPQNPTEGNIAHLNRILIPKQ